MTLRVALQWIPLELRRHNIWMQCFGRVSLSSSQSVRMIPGEYMSPDLEPLG